MSKITLKILSLAFLYLIIEFTSPEWVKAQSGRVTGGPTSSGCYRHPVSPITYAPPLRLDMSFKTLLGYVYFDSLLRSLSTEAQINSYLDQINSFDTLKYLDMFLYAMRDYDPILFYEYCLAANSLNPSYQANPLVLLYSLSSKVSKISVPFKHSLLVNVSMIHHIKIKSIDFGYDTMASVPKHPLPMLCITAEVLDTIKGKHFISSECSMQQSVSNPCIKFSFSPLWDYSGEGDKEVVKLMRDSLGNLTVPYPYGTDFLKVDSEYIAFLGAYFLDHDGTYSYYTYWPCRVPGLHGGFLVIDSNGKVHDDDNKFGYGALTPTTNFISSLRQDINTLLNP